MSHRLDGAHGKLERAHENILNLEREITVFLQDGPYQVIPYDDPKIVQEAAKFHANRIIPSRFAILIGEIIHHLRSCLDHIAWQLSSAEEREAHPGAIEFPIFSSKPSDKSAINGYERKIKGVSAHGRKIIEQLQPYHRDPAFLLTGPVNDPLWIIHDMDIIDKHRELIITIGGFNIATEDGMAHMYLMLYREGNFPEDDIASLGRSLDPNSKITPQISFQDFGRRKVQPVIPGLSKLAAYVHAVLFRFANECF